MEMEFLEILKKTEGSSNVVILMMQFYLCKRLKRVENDVHSLKLKDEIKKEFKDEKRN